MTNKKEKILSTALELFASNGHAVVATSKIAKQAGVSEGLIFRHFENKKGLLNSLVAEGEARVAQLFAPILAEENPKKVIRKTIDLPFSIQKKEYDFWTLQFKLKWDAEYDNPQKMEAVKDKLTWAFKELGYQKPRGEAELLNHLIDSIAVSILKYGVAGEKANQALLIRKYEV